MFDFFFTGALTNNDVGFVSDQKITLINIPILIMHAKVKEIACHHCGLD